MSTAGMCGEAAWQWDMTERVSTCIYIASCDTVVLQNAIAYPLNYRSTSISCHMFIMCSSCTSDIIECILVKRRLFSSVSQCHMHTYACRNYCVSGRSMCVIIVCKQSLVHLQKQLFLAIETYQWSMLVQFTLDRDVRLLLPHMIKSTKGADASVDFS